MSDKAENLILARLEQIWESLREPSVRPKHASELKGFAPGTFGCHEALDRAALIADLAFELSEHRAIILNDDWRKMAADAAEKLYALYQAIGKAHLGEDPLREEVEP